MHMYTSYARGYRLRKSIVVYLQAELVVQSLYAACTFEKEVCEDKSAPDVSPAVADELLTSSLGNY